MSFCLRYTTWDVFQAVIPNKSRIMYKKVCFAWIFEGVFVIEWRKKKAEGLPTWNRKRQSPAPEEHDILKVCRI